MGATGNTRLIGTSLAPGLAVGRAFVYRDALEQDLYAYQVQPDQVDSECERVHRAAEQVLDDLEHAARRVTEQIGPYQAEIFVAHQMMLRELLEDREIRAEMKKERANAEVAVQSVFQRWVDRIQVEESTTFAQRAEDVADLGGRLIRALQGVSVHPLEAMPRGSVVVARRLFPSDAVFFANRDAAGIVVQFGGPGSHCALMTRQIGIPGVCNIQGATEEIATGDTVLVDGFREAVVVAPDSQTRAAFETRIKQYRAHVVAAREHCREPAVGPNGRRIPVMANIANPADARVAAENGADGVGLYRLEALFMLRKTLPTEQELLDEIRETLAPLQDTPAMVRLLDVGSDKDLPYLEFASEPAPCLGMRGVRVLLAHPELLKVQLRALLRLSQSRAIQIVVPMVTIAADMHAVRRAVEAQASELGIDRVPPLVAMVETPAAALCVPDILRFADGISLGTNDLAQYTMAAGRQNPLVQQYFRDDHPAVLRLVRMAVQEAGDAPVAACGELAGQPAAVRTLLDAGVRLLSVAPPLVPSIKEAVRHPFDWADDRANDTRKPSLEGDRGE